MNYIQRHQRLMHNNKKTQSYTLEGDTLRINDSLNEAIDKFVIYGSTVQSKSNASLTMSNTSPLITETKINIITHDSENIITNELINKLSKIENWTEIDGTLTGKAKKLFKSPPIQLKPDTLYRIGSTYPYLDKLYPDYSNIYALGYDYLKPKYPFDKTRYWLDWGSNFAFHTDNYGIFHLYVQCTEEYPTEFRFGSVLKGLTIAEVLHKDTNFKDTSILIPSSIQLDNGNIINIDMGGTIGGHDDIVNQDFYPEYNSIEVENGRVYYIQRTYECTLDGGGITSPDTYAQLTTDSTGAVLYINPGWMYSIPQQKGKIPYNDNGWGILCNKLKAISRVSYSEVNTISFGRINNHSICISIRVPLSEFPDYDTTNTELSVKQTAIKNWLKKQYDAGDPLIIRYPLQTPIVTDVTDSNFGRQFSQLTLKRNNTISTDSPTPNKLSISYQREGHTTSCKYTNLQYLKGDGGQIIDTGIIPTENTSYEIKFSFDSETETSNMFHRDKWLDTFCTRRHDLAQGYIGPYKNGIRIKSNVTYIGNSNIIKNKWKKNTQYKISYDMDWFSTVGHVGVVAHYTDGTYSSGIGIYPSTKRSFTTIANKTVAYVNIQFVYFGLNVGVYNFVVEELNPTTTNILLGSDIFNISTNLDITPILSYNNSSEETYSYNENSDVVYMEYKKGSPVSTSLLLNNENEIVVQTNTDYLIKYSNGKVNINGVENEINPLVNTSTNPISLFGSNNLPYASTLKLYYCKIWEGNILVRDFIPVKDKYDINCLYDKVTKQYFYSNQHYFHNKDCEWVNP